MRRKNLIKFYVAGSFLVAALGVGQAIAQASFPQNPQTAGCLRSSAPNTTRYCCACGGSNCYGVCC